MSLSVGCKIKGCSPVVLIINSFSIFSLLERIFNGTADCFVCGEAVAGQGGFSGRSAVVMVRRSALQSWNTA